MESKNKLFVFFPFSSVLHKTCSLSVSLCECEEGQHSSIKEKVKTFITDVFKMFNLDPVIICLVHTYMVKFAAKKEDKIDDVLLSKLLLCLMMVAGKVVQDEPLTNKHWATQSFEILCRDEPEMDVFTSAEKKCDFAFKLLNILEFEVLNMLDWELGILQEDMVQPDLDKVPFFDISKSEVPTSPANSTQVSSMPMSKKRKVQSTCAV